MIYVGSGRQVPSAMLTLALLFTLNWITYTQILPLLPSTSNLFKWLNIPLSVILVYNFFVCCFRDPGAVPSGSVSPSQAQKKIRQQEELNQFKYISEEAYEVDEVVDDHLQTSREVYRPGRTRGHEHETAESSTMTGSEPINTQKYCDECKIVKEPSTKHCKVCGVCVRQHEIHCGLLANCIGMRTARNYFLMLTSLYFLDLSYIVLGVCAIYFNSEWYIRYADPTIRLQTNDIVYIGIALLILLLSRMTARRMKLARLLSLILVIGVTFYVKNKAHIEFLVDSRIALEILMTVVIAYMILPTIGRSWAKLLTTVIFMTTYIQEIQSQNAGVTLSIVCKNLRRFVFTPPTSSLV